MSTAHNSEVTLIVQSANAGLLLEGYRRRPHSGLKLDEQAEVPASRHGQLEVWNASLSTPSFEANRLGLVARAAVRGVMQVCGHLGISKLDLFHQGGLLQPFAIDALGSWLSGLVRTEGGSAHAVTTASASKSA
ncbi:hypothetical protein D9M71_726920 [compost metagenome]